MRVLTLIAFVVAVPLWAAAQSTMTLAEYVAKPDDSFAFEVVDQKELGTTTVYFVSLTSQTWQGLAWQHWVTIYKPATISRPGHAMLLVTGRAAPSFDSGEGKVLAQIAQSTGTITAMIEQVPNQPLFNGLQEDGIIALTFEKFLKDEGDDWPLLLPMTKSAVRAMDAVQAIGKDSLQADISEFFVLGGSKRGWTTWLTAAVDDRLLGIAPCVIDTLNMPNQNRLQLMSYGAYSEQIKDYTQRDIQGWHGTERGDALLNLVDPYAYRQKLTLPKLIVLGTNDPYWTVDSSSLYFPDLEGAKYLYYCANTGHDVNVNGAMSISAFYTRLMDGTPMPELKWTRGENGALDVQWNEDGQAKIWTAIAPTRDFREATWEAKPLDGTRRVQVTAPETPAQCYSAYYVEVTFVAPGGGRFGLCTEMTVLPEGYPFPDPAADAVLESR